MAALQKIRNKAGLLIGALGIALLAFVLGDLLTSGGTWMNKFRDKAFVVDGDVVSTGEYQQRIAQYEEFFKWSNNTTSIDENTSSEIREYIYSEMVKEMILDEQAKILGLAVSKEEMNDMVYGENISPVLARFFTNPQTRQLELQGLMQFLSFIQTDINSLSDEQKYEHQVLLSHWLVIENMMKYNRLEEKYNNLVNAAMQANDVEAKANADNLKFNTNLAYAIKRYTAVSDSAVTVSDKEVQDLYNQRKNSFKTNTEQAKVSYFVRNITPSEEDYAEISTLMNDIYTRMETTENPALLVADYSEVPYEDIYFSQANLDSQEKNFVAEASVGEVYGPIRENESYRLIKLIDKIQAPDSVNLRMISIPLADATLANAIADSIENVIRGGKDFAEVANEINPQSNGGLIDWVTEENMASAGDEFIRSVFKASKGDVLRLKINNMPQIVKIEDKTAPVEKYKLAVVQMSVPVSERTLNNLDNELNQFIAEYGDKEKFNEGALEKGYNLMSNMQITPSNTGLPQVVGSSRVVSWAFNENVGTINKFDLSDQRVVAIITEKSKAGYASLSDVSSMLKAELLKDKKAEKIIADLKEKNLSSLDSYAEAMDTRVDTVKFVNFTTATISGLGREPMMNVYSEYADLNSVQGPVQGNAGVLVATVLERQPTQSAADMQTVSKNNLNRTYSYRITPMSLLEVMKEKMDVEDNRYKFF